MPTYPLNAGILPILKLHRSCSCCHYYCKLICSSTMLCQETILTLWIFTPCCLFVCFSTKQLIFQEFSKNHDCENLGLKRRFYHPSFIGTYSSKWISPYAVNQAMEILMEMIIQLFCYSIRTTISLNLDLLHFCLQILFSNSVILSFEEYTF